MSTSMNFDQARLNMIEQQIRTWEVLNQDVLNLIAVVHREDFVPNQYRQLAFADTNIPLAHNEVTMTPKVEARLLQAVAVTPGDNVLEIGTGCAYMTALLAKSASHVTSVDIYPDFTLEARDKLGRLFLDNVVLETGDAINGWPQSAPYDVIVVTGSVPVLEPHFQQQLTTGGRLFVITGVSPVMEAYLITRLGDDEWATEALFETDLPPLIGAPRRDEFSF
ncbi:MAG TPA: protein-L-isoaspartate O-methyltransferase [Gammaproteobacteria bacterium]|nr:protein-L-isoaspartate O-methyltransferase [Gammaproteobacteria bacterium]